MKRLAILVVCGLLASCTAAAQVTTTVSSTSSTTVPTTTSTTLLPGETLMVTSTADSGPGSFREALETAQPYDRIVFDPLVFPPESRGLIELESELPTIEQGNLTVDARGVSVHISGQGRVSYGLAISSSSNVVMGLSLSRFTVFGIGLIDDADDNMIGVRPEVGDFLPDGGNHLFQIGMFGIAVWDDSSGNVIAGNDMLFVGEDSPGEGVGILVETADNVVGPSNTVAKVAGHGILVRGPGAAGNRVTANSVYDNWLAITMEPGTTEIEPPVILDLDVGAGSMTGLTCPGCRVEVYSDPEGQTGSYEGAVDADETGNFVFSKGGAFVGERATATATHVDLGSGPPTRSGAGRQEAVFQFGLQTPRTLIPMTPRSELEPHWIGDVFPIDPYQSPCPDPGGLWVYTHADNLGYTHVRVSVDSLEHHSVVEQDAYSRSFVNSCQDRAITFFADQGIEMIHTIVHWDANLHRDRPPDYGNRVEVGLFLGHTRMLVRQLGDRIKYWEILNEPVHYVEVSDYINLIRQVIPVIREEQPDARIVVGGATDLMHPYSLEYLYAVISSDVTSLVDAVNLHPMYGPSPQYAETRDYYYGYPEMISDIRATAAAAGFEGEFIAEEMDWRTVFNPNEHEPWEYTPTSAAKYYLRGIVINRGLGLWALIGGEMYDVIEPIPTALRRLTRVMSGAAPTNTPVQVASQMSPIAHYAFTRPNGDLTVAVWHDGVAGESAELGQGTVTIAASQPIRVVAVDPLIGYQQEVSFRVEGDQVHIDGLVLRDYPIFLRLEYR